MKAQLAQVAHQRGRHLERGGPNAVLQTLARAGLGSRGVIYVTLGVLASLIVARGRPPAQTSGTGALAEIARQPAGTFLLGLLSAGLLCYGAWRLVQAVMGVEPSEGDRPSASKRLGWVAIAAVYVALFAQSISILAGSGASGGAASHPAAPAARVLSWPAGTFILGLVGTGLALAAIALTAWGTTHDYQRTLDRRRTPAWALRATRASGIAGNVTRGVLLALVATYTFMAAVDDSPSRVKSLDQSLQAVRGAPAGPWWIALIAAGLISFGVDSLLEMRYRQI